MVQTNGGSAAVPERHPVREAARRAILARASGGGAIRVPELAGSWPLTDRLLRGVALEMVERGELAVGP